MAPLPPSVPAANPGPGRRVAALTRALWSGPASLSQRPLQDECNSFRKAWGSLTGEGRECFKILSPSHENSGPFAKFHLRSQI